MKRQLRRFALSIAVLLCGLVPLASSAEDGSAEGGGLGNPFFVLSNGVADAAHATPESQAAMLKELGCDGIAPSGTGGVAEMLAALDAEGLDLTALYVGANLDDEGPKYEPGLPEAIRTLKGRPTCIWLYLRSKQFGPSTTDGDQRAVEIVREIAEMAEQSGIRVALYPHTGFYVQRVEDAVRVADKVDRPNVGVTFNLCHWLKVDGPTDLEKRLRLALPRLFLVTINGADHDGENWDRLIQPLDFGSFDVCGLLKTLVDLGYKGPIGLQCYAVPGDKKENLRRSMVAWREYSKRLAGPDADEAAKPDRWEPAIAKFEAMDREQPPAKEGIVFIGSSSIVKWKLDDWFPDLPVLNRGFGGSQIADSVRYADRILVGYRPRIVVFYAGDNDIAAGKSPQQVLADYKAFVAKVYAALPETRIVYVAIKPSLKRWHLIGQIREANRLIRLVTEADPRLEFVDVDAPMLSPDGKPRAELFVSDGLHLSDEGYKLWAELVRPRLKLE
jgi:sugar phosphate isomerase/epimerase/lysophospholipase L1-like esterase